jgi:hypothetical protein
MDVLTSAGAVIDALGGTQKLAELIGKSPQTVSNWRTNGFSAKTADFIRAELQAIGKTAPGSLWGMMEPRRPFHFVLGEH